MAVGLNSRPKEWSRPPEPHPPDAGCWCSRNKRRPDVSLIWCSTPSGHRNGLRLWIQTNGRKTALQPLNLTLDFEHAHVRSHSREVLPSRKFVTGSHYPPRRWVPLRAPANTLIATCLLHLDAVDQPGSKLHLTFGWRAQTAGGMRPSLYIPEGWLSQA